PYPTAPRLVIERLARDSIEVAGPILERSPCLTPAALATIAKERGGRHAQTIAARAPISPPPAPAAAATDAAQSGARELSELFYAAGAHERRLILVNLDYSLIAPSQPFATMQRSDIWRLESAALQHNIETVMREVERTLGISRATARRIVNDELGEPIVVAAK